MFFFICFSVILQKTTKIMHQQPNSLPWKTLFDVLTSFRILIYFRATPYMYRHKRKNSRKNAKRKRRRRKKKKKMKAMKLTKRVIIMAAYSLTIDSPSQVPSHSSTSSRRKLSAAMVLSQLYI